MKLKKEFYLRDTITIAKELLGKVFVFNNNGDLLKARIIETEAYIGSIDKACHCYGNKITKRTEVMFNEGGCIYVYMIYGMYHCLNIVTEEKEHGCAVLIRAVEPLVGYDEMMKNRYGVSVDEANKYQTRNISNGPGKLCMAFGITREHNGNSLTGNDMYIIDDGYKDFEIGTGKRVNIDYAEEAKDFMWRYYLV